MCTGFFFFQAEDGIRDIGVTGVQTCALPIYDVSDYTGIHPLFGTLDDFDRLVAEAHGRGLKVILDFVPNNTSDRHPWFLESRSSRDDPRRDWYLWRDPAPDGGPPNNWLSTFE